MRHDVVSQYVHGWTDKWRSLPTCELGFNGWEWRLLDAHPLDNNNLLHGISPNPPNSKVAGLAWRDQNRV